MRILHCLRAPVGGLFRHVLDLAREQAARGHDVGILADANAENRLTPALFDAIAPHLSLGIARISMSRQPGLGDIAAASAIVKHARPLNLDVLHGHGAKGGAYARLARRPLRAKGQDVRVFYTPHGGSLNFKPGTPAARFYLGLERILERASDGLIFESAYARDVYRARVGPGPAPDRVIHNGLQAADFTPHAPKADATDILFIGELRHLKGVHLLLHALSELQKSGSPVSATIVGSGPDEAEFKALSQNLGLDALVRFMGALPAREALGLGRVMVVPSLAESFPYVVLEAAAAGMPLIATRVGGIPEIVADTDTALIEPGSADALQTAIAAAFANPAAASEKATRLKARVAAMFTVGKMTSDVLTFYGLAPAINPIGQSATMASAR